jgi:hypothetical protein
MVDRFCLSGKIFVTGENTPGAFDFRKQALSDPKPYSRISLTIIVESVAPAPLQGVSRPD